MRTIVLSGLTLALLSASSALHGQKAYIIPSPTDAEAEVTLYVDVSQSQDGIQNNALKAMLTDHPDDEVYLWTWEPSGPDGVGGNGASWNDSNEALKLTKIAPLLYSITFVPTEFYDTDPATFFQRGISCLAKLKDGKAYEGEYDGEAKTEDLAIEIIPKLCDKRICVFPDVRQKDDFVSITYDNNQELNPDLQNIGEDEVFVYMAAKTGPFTIYPYVSAAEVPNRPELQMKPVYGRPGFFRLTFIPEDYWPAIPEDQLFSEIIFYIIRDGVAINIPVFESLPILACD